MRPLILFALVASTGCLETKTARGGQCSLTSDCDAPLVCRFEACRIECTSNRDCALGLDCLYDENQLGACQLPEEASCLDDANCGEGQICRVRDDMMARTCTTECGPERACPPGATCMEGACIDPDTQPCLYNSDCDNPKACAFDQRCRDECEVDGDCRAPLMCRTFTTDEGEQTLCDVDLSGR